MTAAHQLFAESRPLVGDPIIYEGKIVGKVSSIDGNLCWTSYYGDAPAPFIWCFQDGLNALHSWPTKMPHHPLTFCPPLA